MSFDLSVALPVILIVLFLLLAIRVPIAISLGLVGFLGLLWLAGPKVAVNALGQFLFAIPANFILLAVPLFILMAEIIIFTGIADDAYLAMDSLFSGLNGGLALGTVGAGVIFGCVTGSSVASSATIGPVAIAEMMKRGYKKSLASGVIACAGGLAILIPPSIPLIIYGYLAEVSVTRLFIAGTIPGLLLAVSFAAIIVIWSKVDPTAGPSIHALSFKERVRPLKKLWPFILLGGMVLGSIYMGIATPTEAAAVGTFGSVVLSLVYRRFTLGALHKALLSAAKTTGFVLFILTGALIFTFLLNYLRIPVLVTQAVSLYSISPLALISLVMLLLLGLGCIADAITVLILGATVLLPSILAAGFDPIWYGIMITLNVEMAVVTPPVGMNLFVAHAIGKPYGVTFGDVVKGMSPFLLADAALMVLMVAFPNVSLWLVQILAA